MPYYQEDATCIVRQVSSAQTNITSSVNLRETHDTTLELVDLGA
jgi:hypothetical protein